MTNPVTWLLDLLWYALASRVIPATAPAYNEVEVVA